MKVLLVYPNQPKVATKPPLGLMYIASVLRNVGHKAKIIEGDYEAVKQQFDNLTIDNFPDFIGITCMTSQYHEILKMRDYFHEWDVPLVFGGPHASILPETLLTDKEHFVDFVVVGEAEKTILDIIYWLSNEANIPYPNQIVQGELIGDLDSLPFPARDLVPKRYFRHGRTSILASRGCPFNCAFCQPTLRKVFGNKVRRRSVGNVLAEMVESNYYFGLDTFEFFDDTFTSDKDWVYDFCDEVEEYHFSLEVLSRVDMLDFDLLKRMKEAGLKRVSLGIESASQEVLNSYAKGTTVEQNLEAVRMCNRLGIKVHGFFMVGALNETRESLEATRKFLRMVDFHTIFVTVTMPMPCTRLYFRAEKEGRLNSDWRDFDYLGNLTTTGGSCTPPIKLEHLSTQEIVDARYDLLKTFYLRKARNPLYLMRFIWENGWKYTWNAAKHILRRL